MESPGNKTSNHMARQNDCWKSCTYRVPLQPSKREITNIIHKLLNKTTNDFRKKSQHPARCTPHRAFLLFGILHCRDTVCPKPVVQPAHRGHHPRHALRQQPAQPAPRNVGAGHQTVHQADIAHGHCALRLPPHLPASTGNRTPGRGHRRDCHLRHHCARRRGRACAEDGRENGPHDLHRKRHLRSRSRARSRTGGEMRPLQNSHRRVDGGHLRHHLDVPLPHHVSHRTARPRPAGHGHLYRLHAP